MGFLQVESARVGDGGNGEHQEHSGDGNQAAKIEDAPSEAGHFRVGSKPEREICESEKDANFRGAEFCEGHAKNAERVRGQVALDGQKQKRDEHSGGDAPVESAGNSKAAHEESCTYGVDDVVDIKAVAGALAIADACERAVETVSEPVEREKKCGEQQAERIPARKSVARAREQHGNEAEKRQMVGIYFCGDARGEPEQDFAFWRGCETFLQAVAFLNEEISLSTVVAGGFSARREFNSSAVISFTVIVCSPLRDLLVSVEQCAFQKAWSEAKPRELIR